MKLVGLSGSLREGSIHTSMLKQVSFHLVDNIEFNIVSIDLPLYNEDIDDTVDASNKTPEVVAQFKQHIDEADGVIIASPEYNHSVTGPLKNAIDWVSRPAFDSPLKNKPILILSASPSPVGAVRAQSHLRLILTSTLSHVFVSHEYSLGSVRQLIDENNIIRDENSIRRLKRIVTQFIAYIEAKNN